MYSGLYFPQIPRGIRRLVVLATLALSVSIPLAASAETLLIFDMRKSLPLESDEVPTREFYVNGGPESGLRPGMFVRVIRSLPVHDPIGNKAQATMTVPVGVLKVIHSERGISVARPHSELGDDERPTLEYEGVMIGDKLDLSSATMDEPKAGRRKPARKSAAAAAAEAFERVSAAVESAPAPQAVESAAARGTSSAPNPPEVPVSPVPAQGSAAPKSVPAPQAPASPPASVTVPVPAPRSGPASAASAGPGASSARSN